MVRILHAHCIFVYHVRKKEHVGSPRVQYLASLLVQGEHSVLRDGLFHVASVHIVTVQM